MKINPLLVAVYSRVSREGQDSSNQLLQLREFAAKQGWVIYKEYVDDAVSGTRAGSSRPAFSQLMEDAKEKRFEILLFWSLDRLSREGTSATLAYLNNLSALGVGFRSYTEQYLDSCGAFKDAVLAILSCVAKLERTRISDRTRAGLERARKQGKILGRKSILTEEVIARVRSLRASGAIIQSISTQCGISVGLVHKICSQKAPSSSEKSI